MKKFILWLGAVLSAFILMRPVETKAANTYQLEMENGVVTGYTGSPVDLIIPEGVTAINPSVFSGCSTLKTVQLPSTLQKLGYDVFKNCVNLESINIPKSLTTVDSLYGVFKNCNNLTDVTFEKGVTQIPANLESAM